MVVPRVEDPGRVIAHRGASRVAPENTIAAFKTAVEQGVSWIEFDVSLMGDGTPVIFHDATLERCSDRVGHLSAYSLADLARIDAGGWFSDLYQGEPIPSLGRLLELVGEYEIFANLEIKTHYEVPERIAEVVATELSKHVWASDRIVVSSFEIPTLKAFRARAPDQPLAVLWPAPPSDWQVTTRSLQASALHMDYRALTSELLLETQRERLDLRVYTINQPELLISFRELGLTSVITDHPPLFLNDPDWCAWSETPRRPKTAR